MSAQRDPRVRDPAYMGWIAKLPCVACLVHGTVNWRVHVAHLRAASLEHGKRYTGKGEKPSDLWTLPLCPPHHTGDKTRAAISQHSMSEEQFWAAFGIDPFQLCLDLNKAYAMKGRGKSITGGMAVLSIAAARGRHAIEGDLK